MNGKRCRIKGTSKYFKEKYGSANPEIQIECTDIEAWGRSWMAMDGNPTAMLYGMRSGLDGLPWVGNVYYGKIKSLGELVHESELEVL